MGMFDYVRCRAEPANFPDEEFQTKDTPTQWMDEYEIRADGTLWHETYDTEDRSDPNAEGFKRFIGCMTRVNNRWGFEPFDGVIDFYGTINGAWVEFRALFNRGRLVRDIEIIVDERAADILSASAKEPE